MYLYQFVGNGNNLLLTFEQATEKFNIIGYNENTSQREELQEQPRFEGYNGPMYNGKQNNKTVIRYETTSHYLKYD